MYYVRGNICTARWGKGMKGAAFKVTGFANMILLAINAVSLAGVVLFIIFGVAGQIFGTEDAGGQPKGCTSR